MRIITISLPNISLCIHQSHKRLCVQKQLFSATVLCQRVCAVRDIRWRPPFSTRCSAQCSQFFVIGGIVGNTVENMYKSVRACKDAQMMKNAITHTSAFCVVRERMIEVLWQRQWVNAFVDHHQLHQLQYHRPDDGVL